MDSKEKQNILRLIELLNPLDWIPFSDTNLSFSHRQYGVIELLFDTTSLIEKFANCIHCEETKLFNAIVLTLFGPNQSVMLIRYGYLNKVLRCLEAIFSGQITRYISSRAKSPDSTSDDLSFIKGSVVKKMAEKDDKITGVLKFRDTDALEVLKVNGEEITKCGIHCTFRIGCTYNVLMFVPDVGQLVKVWMEKE